MTETDPHDIFVIEPDVVLAARADKPPENPAQDTSSRAAPKVHPLIAEVSGITAGPSVPPVDTRFRATAVSAPATEVSTPAADGSEIAGQIPNQVSDKFTATKPSRGRWTARALIGFLFAICSAMAAAAWPHYGDVAKQKMTAWIPTFFQASSAPEKATAAEPPAAATAQSTVADQTPATADQAAPQPASPTQTTDATAPAAATEPASAQVQAMARDMATMGQQIEQLKASIEQLKAGQEKMSQQMSHDLVKNTVARLSDPNPRARIAPPPRPVRKPKPVYYTPAQATPAPLPPPQTAIAPAPLPPPTQAPSDSGGDPVVRPPMPLR